MVNSVNDLFDDPLPPPLSRDAQGIPLLVHVLAAAGVPLGRNRILDLIRAAQVSTTGRSGYSNDMLSADLQQATKAGQVEAVKLGYVCKPDVAQQALREIVASGDLAKWRAALFKYFNVPDRPGLWGYPRSEGDATSVFRIALLTGMSSKALGPVIDYLNRYDLTMLFFNGLCRPFDPALFECIAPAERDQYAERGLMWMLSMPNASASVLVEWAWRRAQDRNVREDLRYRACEHLLWQGRVDEVLHYLQSEDNGAVVALRAAAAAMQRKTSDARDLYTKAFAALRGAERKKAGVLPFSNSWLYTAALIVSGEVPALEEARRHARAEGRALGYEGQWQWQGIEQAATQRLGDSEAATQDVAFHPMRGLPGLVSVETAAWRKQRTNAVGIAHVQRCGEEFASAGYAWAARECEAAALVLNGKMPSGELLNTLAAAFANEQTWRRALVAITALSEAKRTDAGDTRIVWIISMKRDTVTGVTPCEQKRGPRGWNKGKRASYARLAKTELLAPHDVQACQALDRYSNVSYDVNIDRVLPALIGHPLVFFEDNVDLPVELVAGEPEITVTRTKAGKGNSKGTMRVSINPDIRALTTRLNSFSYEAPSTSRNRETSLLLKETATRARVIRITAAHRRVAELIGESLEVPEEGAQDLSQAIESASRYFNVHSDVASAVPELPADGSLRAELAPAGDGLRLRLAVQPFGDSGPRFAPGAGGARVIAELSGEKRAAVRDLALEKRAAQDVLELLIMLDGDSDDFEWAVPEPEDCLALVETLQGMTDKVRVEWPAGAKFKVTRAYGAADLILKMSSGTDWFAATGGIRLDEGTVIDMVQLIAFAREAGGRFVPLGEGGYLTLTDDLKRRIDDIAALGEVTKDGVRMHPLAAGALEEIAEGMQWNADATWKKRLALVRAAQTLEAELPSTFSGDLREYQRDGFKWLARLAHWGAGACLADDMGLGKTVQALALLLRRAPDGAAMVVAPTSVCAQWVQEALRFAPTLNMHLFSEAGNAGERAKLVAGAGAFDVVVCTYTLMQQEIERFTDREWHTVLLDEAQAVKNFATKRAQAVFSLKADFRVATTGTPVENRLDELWTLFRFLNPGLLGSRERFNDRYAAPIERMRDGRARARLKRLVRPFILRRTKSEVLTELPPRTEIVIEVEPSDQERAFYEALRRDALMAIDGGGQPLAQRRFQVLAQLMRLRRSCCDPRLVTPELGISGAKLEAFAGVVEELIANKHKALVFSQFVDYLTLLRRELERMNVAYQYLDGSTPVAERARAVANFQKGEGDIFLISLRAGGFGLNLTAADYVIIADPWWNPAVEDQAASRAHRMGQERPVTVYRLVVKGSVEERIMAMHQDKRALAEGLFGGEEFGGAVSVDELVGLMREEG